MRKVWIWLMVVSVAGVVASVMMDGFSDDYKAYGEVPIPGSARLHLPAGDVLVSFHADGRGLNQGRRGDVPLLPIPQGLELAITASSGAPQPSVTDHRGGGGAGDNDAHRQLKVAHIPVAGDYTITTNGTVGPFRLSNGQPGHITSPRLSFGHDFPLEFLLWLFLGLLVVSAVAFPVTLVRQNLRTASSSITEVLASGQRVRGVLKSFRATGKTPRSRGVTPSRPDFLDYPYYRLKVELQFPNQASVVGRNRQIVPPTEVPNLAIGRELNCAVDPARPSYVWVVDWS